MGGFQYQSFENALVYQNIDKLLYIGNYQRYFKFCKELSSRYLGPEDSSK